MPVRQHRLRLRSEFQTLYSRGTTIRGTSLKWHWLAQGSRDRWAIVVSTKISKQAVVRNRLRRVIDGLLRTWSNQRASTQLPLSLLVVVVALPRSERSFISDIQQCLIRISTIIERQKAQTPLRQQ